MQGGSGGKWKTPNHKAKDEVRVTIAPGDVGIWATCARGQEGKATTELKGILYQVCYDYSNNRRTILISSSLPRNSMASPRSQKMRTRTEKRSTLRLQLRGKLQL